MTANGRLNSFARRKTGAQEPIVSITHMANQLQPSNVYVDDVTTRDIGPVGGITPAQLAFNLNSYDVHDDLRLLKRSSGAAVLMSIGDTFIWEDSNGRLRTRDQEPVSKDTDGSVLAGPVNTTSENTTYTVEKDRQLILADAAGGAFTITLLPAADVKVPRVVIKKIDGTANVVTIDGDGGQTIDGALTTTLTAQWDSVDLASSGSAWFIVASHP